MFYCQLISGRDSSIKKGEDGITILKRLIENNLQWIFRPNHKEHDFGIDAYIDIINEFGQITGKSIACQVKTGASYFKEKTDFGWVYRGEMSHLNYYLNHDIPVLIILVNEASETAYWCHCDAQKTEKSGNNWKITVPSKQTISKNFQNELRKYISPVRDYVSQLDHFWAFNNQLKESERLIFIIDRPEIETTSFTELINGLNRIQVNPELIKHVKEKVDIWVHGYNDDPRELREIPEVKAWVLAMFNEVKGLAYFLIKDEYAQFFRVLQSCKMKFTKIEGSDYIEDGILKHKAEIDLSNSPEFLEELFLDLNKFTDKHNIPEEVNKEITGNIFEYLFNERPPGL